MSKIHSSNLLIIEQFIAIPAIFLIGYISSKVNLLNLLLFELWLSIVSFGFKIYFMHEIEGSKFGLSFVINYLVLGPLYALSKSLIYRAVKPESAGLIITINKSASLLIMSFVSYFNGKIQDSHGQSINIGTYHVFVFNFILILIVTIIFTFLFLQKGFNI